MDIDQLAQQLHVQAGVLSRGQLTRLGARDSDVRRLLRRRELTRVHPRVYVNHTGPLTWLQRAWAATLACEPAALRDRSALRAAGGPGRRLHADGPIEVAIDHTRRILAPPGVDLRRIVGLDDQVLWNASPPRLRTEHASLRLAAGAASEVDAVAFLADPVGARMTTGPRLAGALRSHPRIARREFLARVIADVGAGTCSTLEQGYLARVERPHGLPFARRQVRESAKGPLYRDVLHEEFGLVVEIDGRMFHAQARQHDADLERDLDVAATDRATVRVGWGQVFDRPCSTAFKVGRVLQHRGWCGAPRRCPRCPPGLLAVA